MSRTMATAGAGGPTPKSPAGLATCRWCKGEVTTKRRKTFCSDACVEEWNLRTNPGHARRRVYVRDAGVCEICRVDTKRIERLLRALRNLVWGTPERFDGGRRDDIAWPVYDVRQLVRACAIYGRLRGRGFNCWIIKSAGAGYVKMGWRTLWEMDHRLPVCEGGGHEFADQMANLRSLCCPCHKAATRDLNAKLAARRRTLNGKTSQTLLEALRAERP